MKKLATGAGGYLTVASSSNQRKSASDATLLENTMNVLLYGSLGQANLARYFFVRKAATNQRRDLLFAIGQHATLRSACAYFPGKSHFDTSPRVTTLADSFCSKNNRLGLGIVAAVRQQ